MSPCTPTTSLGQLASTGRRPRTFANSLTALLIPPISVASSPGGNRNEKTLKRPDYFLATLAGWIHGRHIGYSSRTVASRPLSYSGPLPRRNRVAFGLQFLTGGRPTQLPQWLPNSWESWPISRVHGVPATRLKNDQEVELSCYNSRQGGRGGDQSAKEHGIRSNIARRYPPNADRCPSDGGAKVGFLFSPSKALKKCLEENKGDYVKCKAQVEAFKTTCSLKKIQSANNSPNLNT
ncbi:hypothetical protein HPP92_025464 [Vanilla planifolia]|uniref:Uncharacterized protein n=1 Tax=Vanilla planifolia TaxID=51239 RepID=A0A835PHY4_VANPL|nr:hypothetical protein HPP92_025464 [Vanilla planifolia]